MSRASAAAVRGHRRWTWNRTRRHLFRSRILTKPLSSLLLPANTHKLVQKKGSSPRAKDALSLPSAILSVGLPKAQGKVKGTGEEERPKHPLRAQATPSTLAQQGESGLNPKWVWLFRFSNHCLPPPEVSSNSQVLPNSLTPPPHPQFSSSALERPTASPLFHALVKKLWPQQFIWAQTISRPNDRPFCSQLSLNQVSGGP